MGLLHRLHGLLHGAGDSPYQPESLLYRPEGSCTHQTSIASQGLRISTRVLPVWVEGASFVGRRAPPYQAKGLPCHYVGLLYQSKCLLYRLEGSCIGNRASYIGNRTSCIGQGPPTSVRGLPKPGDLLHKPEDLLYQPGASCIGKRASCIHQMASCAI